MANSTRNLQITKQLNQIAKNVEVNLAKVVEEKLLETYKTNVLSSYSPRSEEASYVHTGTFLSSIYTEVEDTSPTEKTITVMIADKNYPDAVTPRSTVQVHTFLTEGTRGGGDYPYKDDEGRITFAPNYPTPKHEFEEHTIIQMEGFIDSLESDIKAGKHNK